MELVDEGVQSYALVRGIEAPSLPWDRKLYDILFPIPEAYDMGTPLNAFYFDLPYTFNRGEHNRPVTGR